MIKVTVTSTIYLWPIGEHTDSITEFLYDYDFYEDFASMIGRYIINQPSAADIRVCVDHMYDPSSNL